LTAKETELEQALDILKSPPHLIVTDSRVLKNVAEKVPADIPLTTFSILYARYKGDLGVLAAGIRHIDKLKPQDKVLISEACTHHPIGDDIGRVIIPGWLKTLVPDIVVEHAAGYDFPSDVSGYSLVIHCGGCMLNRRAMMNRLGIASEACVPVTNYGMVLARMHGLLDRVMRPFEQKVQTANACNR
jgi:[FeFe] hydrogenase H-cluster maturation GTPase HydF